MYRTCVIAFVIFTSIAKCENVNLTYAKWKYDVDTAEPFETILESKSIHRQ